MKKNPANRSAFFNPRAISLAFCAACALLALIAFGLYPGGNAFARQKRSNAQDQFGSANDFTPGNIQSLQVPNSAQGAASDSRFISNSPLVGCTSTVLINDNSTSGNARAPQTRNQYERSVYLIKASELAAAGYTSGSLPTTIGWNYQTGNGAAGSAPLIVYLQNTADTTNLKSTDLDDGD